MLSGVLTALVAVIVVALLVAAGLAVLYAVTVVPFLLTVDLAERRGCSTGRWAGLSLTAVLVALGLPMLRTVSQALRAPKPDEPPPGFPVWPLWFAAIMFVHVRRAGGLLVLGLAVAAVLDVGLPLGG